MNSETIATVNKLLDGRKNIVIVGHKNPDGDAVGSCLGLYFFLKELGHNPTVIVPNDFPDFLKWLPGFETITIYEKNIGKYFAQMTNLPILSIALSPQINRRGKKFWVEY